MVVKMTHSLYSYCSPVIFLYAAMNFGSIEAQQSSADAITKQQVLQTSIYFILVAITQLKGHGRMTKFLSQMGHCERVLEVRLATRENDNNEKRDEHGHIINTTFYYPPTSTIVPRQQPPTL
jgi:hypothetical protein